MKASDSLFQLISTIEKCVLETVSSQPLEINALNEILTNLEEKKLPFIGCQDHRWKFTNTAIEYYLILCMWLLMQARK